MLLTFHRNIYLYYRIMESLRLEKLSEIIKSWDEIEIEIELEIEIEIEIM